MMITGRDDDEKIRIKFPSTKTFGDMFDEGMRKIFFCNTELVIKFLAPNK